MFEQAIIYNAGSPNKVDIGSLAETLFFYGNVRLVIDRGSLVELIRQIPRDALLELLDLDVVKLTFMRENFAVATSGAPQAHRFSSIRLAGRADGKKIKTHDQEIEDLVERELGRSQDTSKFLQQLIKRVDLQRYRGIPEKEKAILKAAESDIFDPDFLQQAVISTVQYFNENFLPSSDFRFRAMKSDQGDYWIDTNQSFDNLKHSSGDALRQALILTEILEARAETFLAAYYMSEPVSSPLTSAIMKTKHFEFLQRRTINSTDVDLFHELVVPDFPKIREVINSKERSMLEFLDFLSKAHRFKKFITSTSPDLGLIQSYNKEVVKKSWVENLPGKSIRFLIAAGTGIAASAVVGPLGGLAVGATNTFLLDKLLKGWRPNSFIQGPYKSFVVKSA